MLSRYDSRFQGDMSRDKRDKAVRIFMKKNDAPVMLMSLKCGGVGLVSILVTLRA